MTRKNITYDWMVLAVVLCCLVSSVNADTLVQALQGPADVIKVSKDNKPIVISVMSVLTGGEIIKITEESAAVTLVTNNGKTINVDKDNSPYTIKASESIGWIDNAVREALAWYKDLGGENISAVSAVTRGRDDIPLSLLGMDRVENLLPVNVEGLQFFWEGSQGVYRIHLVSEDGTVMLNEETETGHAAYNGSPLDPGAYKFVVESKDGTDKQIIQIVSPDLLPKPVKNLNKATLPDTVLQSVSAMLLAKYPKWRFTALQYALASGDDVLVEAMLRGDMERQGFTPH